MPLEVRLHTPKVPPGHAFIEPPLSGDIIMSTSDFIAQVMIALAPVLLLVGVFIFLYKNKSAWDAEMAELRRKHQADKTENDK